MSLPAGITTCTVTKSPPLNLLGASGTITQATVAADRDIVWAATGETLYGATPVPITLVGDSLSFALAHVDQPGFLDATTGQAVTGWYYTVRATVKYGSTGAKEEVWRLQVTTGTTSMDLDLLERQGQVLPAVTAPAPKVSSVLGKTGVITADDLLSPLAVQLDPMTAALLGNSASQTAAALAAAFEAVTTPQAYGAKGDGIADDTAAVQAAINAAAAAGRALYAPAGTYLVTGLTLPAYAIIRGAGIEATRFKLKPGTTADVFTGANFATLTGTNTNAGVAGVKLSAFTIDGNRANANPGWGIKKYGYRWRIRDLDITGCKAGGIYSEWCKNPLDGADGGTMEDRVENVNTHDGTGFGIQWRGPHDSMFSNVLVFRIGSGGHGISLEGSATYHAGGILMSDVHVYGCGGNGIQTLPDSAGESATIRGVNIESESNGGAGLYLASNSNYITAGNFYNNTGAGIEIANGARAYQIDATVNNNTAGQLKYTNDGGYGFIKVTAWANGKPTVVGTKGPRTVQMVSATSEAAGTVTELGLGTVAPRDITDLFSDDNATLIDSLPRYSAQGELLLTSGRLDLCYFTARRTLTLPNTITATTTQAAAGLTLARIGLYSVATNGDLTLIASTPSDTTLWAATGATVIKAFTAPAALVAGQRYAIGVLAAGTTMPKLAGMVVGSTVVTSLAPRMKASLTTADLPSTITNASLSAFGSSGMPFVRIAP